MSTQNSNSVRQEVSKAAITLDKIYSADYQKEGTLTAQIRQVVTTKSFYPSKKVASDLQANIFGLGDFGFEEQEYSSTETRVAWIPVPTNAKKDEVEAKLKAATEKGACIYKVLSNHPILDENQKYAISQGLTTLHTFANSQVVRYPENHEKAGQIILDNHGKVQYRRTFFWNTPMEDQDARSLDSADAYLSPEIAAELEGASVMVGQTL